MTINFIAAQITDIDQLLEMMRDFYQYDDIVFNDQGARNAVTGLITNSNFGGIWLIDVNAIIVGYCVLTLGYSLEFQGRDAFIDEIYLKDNYRRQGIGQTAIKFLEDQCHRLGVRALHLEVERANVKAQAFYDKVGFTAHNRFLMTKMVGRDDKKID